MIQLRLTQEAEGASQRYLLLTQAWRGLYERLSASPALATPSEIASTMGEARSIASIFMRSELEHVARITQQIVREAHQTTIYEIASNDAALLSDEAHELLNETSTYLSSQIELQAQRDLASLEQALRRVALEVRHSARSRGVGFRQALMEHRIASQARLEFTYHDRATRKWASTKAVRALWRHTLLSVYNEIVLSVMADHGLAHATVDHVNTASQFHGFRIALHASGELPTYGEIRDEVFHPNSDAVLTARAA